MSPYSLLGASGEILFFIFDEIRVSKLNSPRWDAALESRVLGLFCLSMSHKKDARHIWVKYDRIAIKYRRGLFELNFTSDLNTIFRLRKTCRSTSGFLKLCLIVLIITAMNLQPPEIFY